MKHCFFFSPTCDHVAYDPETACYDRQDLSRALQVVLPDRVHKKRVIDRSAGLYATAEAVRDDVLASPPSMVPHGNDPPPLPTLLPRRSIFFLLNTLSLIECSRCCPCRYRCAGCRRIRGTGGHPDCRKACRGNGVCDRARR